MEKLGSYEASAASRYGTQHRGALTSAPDANAASITMGRLVDQDVHAAFIEFRAKEDDKCLSVQCIYCHQVRAKNTSRQKQHLQECPNLQGNTGGPRPASSPSDQLNGQNAHPFTSPPNLAHSGPMTNGSASHNTPMQGTPLTTMPPRPQILSHTPTMQGSSSGTPMNRPLQSLQTPKTAQSLKKSTPGSNLPAPPLDDVHAAFVEFRAKEEDKCLSVQCIYCNQIRAKNTSRQRQHLLECPTYLNVMKDAIPANNLLHRFDEGNIARSLQLPQPTLELDFRMSIKLNPAIPVGHGSFGHRNWVSFIGGQWAGRWGKGGVIPGGQDSQLIVKDLATQVSARYLLQTNDDPPAFITVNQSGWRTGEKAILEKLEDPMQADTINPNTYKFRLNVELETGDERYAFLNSCMWVGSGCRRGAEVIYDAYRIM